MSDGSLQALVDQMPTILGNFYEYNLEDYCECGSCRRDPCGILR